MGRHEDNVQDIPVFAPSRQRDDRRTTWTRPGLALLALGLTSWCIVQLLDPSLPSRRSSAADLDGWIRRQETISYRKILRNIGPAAGAKDGLVIASPSHGEPGQPDYFVIEYYTTLLGRSSQYTWTRDSALTYKTLLHRLLPERYLTPWTFEPYLNGTTAGEDEWSIGGGGGGGRAGEGRDEHDPLLEPLIRSYISSQAELQILHTRSGDLWSGGLNEPKFGADGGMCDGKWGRPQRDGPALRALSLIPYANYLLDRNHTLDGEYVAHSLYDPHLIRAHGRVIKNDLEEVARGWWMEGFDLWEEVGHHLWTRLTALRALQSGAILAARLDDPHAAEYYARSADRIEARLANFWVFEGRHGGYWASSISGKNQFGMRRAPNGGPSAREASVRERKVPPSADVLERHDDSTPGTKDAAAAVPAVDTETGLTIAGKWGQVVKPLDCAFALSLIHAHTYPRRNTSAETSWTSFEPSHPGVLATLRQLAKSFDGEYPINGASSSSWTNGRVLGRYKGDVYDGTGTSLANPWFICTHAFAQALYLAHTSFLHAGQIRLSPHSAPFWADVLDQQTPGSSEQVWTKGDRLFEDALDGLWGVAEAYVRVARRYVLDSGEMSEQIDRRDLIDDRLERNNLGTPADYRINGTQRGARDLTWSHASFLDMARTRRQALQMKQRAEDKFRHARSATEASWTSWTHWLPDLY